MLKKFKLKLYTNTSINLIVGVSILYCVCYTYGTELFPSTIRGTVCGLSFNLARFMGLLAKPLIAMSDKFEIPQIAGCCVSCLFAFPFFFFLPETKDRKVE